MDDMKKVYNPLYLVVNYAPTPTSLVHGVTSHVQVKDPVCSVVTLLHGGSSCRFDSLYFNLRKCNIFVTKLSIVIITIIVTIIFEYYRSRAFFNFLSESQCLRSSPSDQGCIYRIVLLHVYEKLYNIRFLGNHRRLWYKS